MVPPGVDRRLTPTGCPGKVPGDPVLWVAGLWAQPLTHSARGSYPLMEGGGVLAQWLS